MRILAAVAILLLSAANALAWNALGHKVVCEIAWRQLDDSERKEIVDILKRHPRFDKDFIPDMPALSSEESDHWIFLHAGTWPDIARGIQGPDRDKFDKPIWHYINHPFVIEDAVAPPNLNLESDPSKGKSISWNVCQATNYCYSVIRSDAPPQEKALAYCWLFHLVGDLHQPMHSTALFSNRFPKGDRGGNSIKLVKGDNLHSLWDNLLGRSHQLNDVKRVADELRQRKAVWEAVKPWEQVDLWIIENHVLARNFAYEHNLVFQTMDAENPGPFTLPEEYFIQAGEYARSGVIFAGIRLTKMLKRKGSPVEPKDLDYGPGANPLAPQSAQSKSEAQSAAVTPGMTHWLNTNSNVRHNSSCDHYKNTRGRLCGPDEGKPCGICGG